MQQAENATGDANGASPQTDERSEISASVFPGSREDMSISERHGGPETSFADEDHHISSEEIMFIDVSANEDHAATTKELSDAVDGIASQDHDSEPVVNLKDDDEDRLMTKGHPLPPGYGLGCEGETEKDMESCRLKILSQKLVSPEIELQVSEADTAEVIDDAALGICHSADQAAFVELHHNENKCCINEEPSMPASNQGQKDSISTGILLIEDVMVAQETEDIPRELEEDDSQGNEEEKPSEHLVSTRGRDAEDSSTVTTIGHRTESSIVYVQKDDRVSDLVEVDVPEKLVPVASRQPEDWQETCYDGKLAVVLTRDDIPGTPKSDIGIDCVLAEVEVMEDCGAVVLLDESDTKWIDVEDHDGAEALPLNSAAEESGERVVPESWKTLGHTATNRAQSSGDLNVNDIESTEGSILDMGMVQEGPNEKNSDAMDPASFPNVEDGGIDSLALKDSVEIRNCEEADNPASNGEGKLQDTMGTPGAPGEELVEAGGRQNSSLIASGKVQREESSVVISEPTEAVECDVIDVEEETETHNLECSDGSRVVEAGALTMSKFEEAEPEVTSTMPGDVEKEICAMDKNEQHDLATADDTAIAENEPIVCVEPHDSTDFDIYGRGLGRRGLADVTELDIGKESIPTDKKDDAPPIAGMERKDIVQISQHEHENKEKQCLDTQGETGPHSVSFGDGSEAAVDDFSQFQARELGRTDQGSVVLNDESQEESHAATIQHSMEGSMHQAEFVVIDEASNYFSGAVGPSESLHEEDHLALAKEDILEVAPDVVQAGGEKKSLNATGGTEEHSVDVIRAFGTNNKSSRHAYTHADGGPLDNFEFETLERSNLSTEMDRPALAHGGDATVEPEFTPITDFEEASLSVERHGESEEVLCSVLPDREVQLLVSGVSSGREPADADGTVAIEELNTGSRENAHLGDHEEVSGKNETDSISTTIVRSQNKNSEKITFAAERNEVSVLSTSVLVPSSDPEADACLGHDSEANIEAAALPDVDIWCVNTDSIAQELTGGVPIADDEAQCQTVSLVTREVDLARDAEGNRLANAVQLELGGKGLIPVENALEEELVEETVEGNVIEANPSGPDGGMPMASELEEVEQADRGSRKVAKHIQPEETMRWKEGRALEECDGSNTLVGDQFEAPTETPVSEDDLGATAAEEDSKVAAEECRSVLRVETLSTKVEDLVRISGEDSSSTATADPCAVRGEIFIGVAKDVEQSSNEIDAIEQCEPIDESIMAAIIAEEGGGISPDSTEESKPARETLNATKEDDAEEAGDCDRVVGDERNEDQIVFEVEEDIGMPLTHCRIAVDQMPTATRQFRIEGETDASKDDDVEDHAAGKGLGAEVVFGSTPVFLASEKKNVSEESSEFGQGACFSVGPEGDMVDANEGSATTRGGIVCSSVVEKEPEPMEQSPEQGPAPKEGDLTGEAKLGSRVQTDQSGTQLEVVIANEELSITGKDRMELRQGFLVEADEYDSENERDCHGDVLEVFCKEKPRADEQYKAEDTKIGVLAEHVGDEGLVIAGNCEPMEDMQAAKIVDIDKEPEEHHLSTSEEFVMRGEMFEHGEDVEQAFEETPAGVQQLVTGDVVRECNYEVARAGQDTPNFSVAKERETGEEIQSAQDGEPLEGSGCGISTLNEKGIAEAGLRSLDAAERFGVEEKPQTLETVERGVDDVDEEPAEEALTFEVTPAVEKGPAKETEDGGPVATVEYHNPAEILPVEDIVNKGPAVRPSVASQECEFAGYTASVMKECLKEDMVAGEEGKPGQYVPIVQEFVLKQRTEEIAVSAEQPEIKLASLPAKDELVLVQAVEDSLFEFEHFAGEETSLVVGDDVFVEGTLSGVPDAGPTDAEGEKKLIFNEEDLGSPAGEEVSECAPVGLPDSNAGEERPIPDQGGLVMGIASSEDLEADDLTACRMLRDAEEESLVPAEGHCLFEDAVADDPPEKEFVLTDSRTVEREATAQSVKPVLNVSLDGPTRMDCQLLADDDELEDMSVVGAIAEADMDQRDRGENLDSTQEGSGWPLVADPPEQLAGVDSDGAASTEGLNPEITTGFHEDNVALRQVEWEAKAVDSSAVQNAEDSDIGGRILGETVRIERSEQVDAPHESHEVARSDLDTSEDIPAALVAAVEESAREGYEGESDMVISETARAEDGILAVCEQTEGHEEEPGEIEIGKQAEMIHVENAEETDTMQQMLSAQRSADSAAREQHALSDDNGPEPNPNQSLMELCVPTTEPLCEDDGDREERVPANQIHRVEVDNLVSEFSEAMLALDANEVQEIVNLIDTEFDTRAGSEEPAMVEGDEDQVESGEYVARGPSESADYNPTAAEKCEPEYSMLPAANEGASEERREETAILFEQQESNDEEKAAAEEGVQRKIVEAAIVPNKESQSVGETPKVKDTADAVAIGLDSGDCIEEFGASVERQAQNVTCVADADREGILGAGEEAMAMGQELTGEGEEDVPEAVSSLLEVDQIRPEDKAINANETSMDRGMGGSLVKPDNCASPNEGNSAKDESVVEESTESNSVGVEHALQEPERAAEIEVVSEEGIAESATECVQVAADHCGQVGNTIAHVEAVMQKCRETLSAAMQGEPEDETEFSGQSDDRVHEEAVQVVDEECQTADQVRVARVGVVMGTEINILLEAEGHQPLVEVQAMKQEDLLMRTERNNEFADKPFEGVGEARTAELEGVVEGHLERILAVSSYSHSDKCYLSTESEDLSEGVTEGCAVAGKKVVMAGVEDVVPVCVDSVGTTEPCSSNVGTLRSSDDDFVEEVQFCNPVAAHESHPDEGILHVGIEGIPQRSEKYSPILELYEGQDEKLDVVEHIQEDCRDAIQQGVSQGEMGEEQVGPEITGTVRTLEMRDSVSSDSGELSEPVVMVDCCRGEAIEQEPLGTVTAEEVVLSGTQVEASVIAGDGAKPGTAEEIHGGRHDDPVIYVEITVPSGGHVQRSLLPASEMEREVPACGGQGLEEERFGDVDVVQDMVVPEDNIELALLPETEAETPVVIEDESAEVIVGICKNEEDLKEEKPATPQVSAPAGGPILSESVYDPCLLGMDSTEEHAKFIIEPKYMEPIDREEAVEGEREGNMAILDRCFPKRQVVCVDDEVDNAGEDFSVSAEQQKADEELSIAKEGFGVEESGGDGNPIVTKETGPMEHLYAGKDESFAEDRAKYSCNRSEECEPAEKIEDAKGGDVAGATMEGTRAAAVQCGPEGEGEASNEDVEHALEESPPALEQCILKDETEGCNKEDAGRVPGAVEKNEQLDAQKSKAAEEVMQAVKEEHVQEGCGERTPFSTGECEPEELIEGEEIPKQTEWSSVLVVKQVEVPDKSLAAAVKGPAEEVGERNLVSSELEKRHSASLSGRDEHLTGEVNGGSMSAPDENDFDHVEDSNPVRGESLAQVEPNQLIIQTSMSSDDRLTEEAGEVSLVAVDEALCGIGEDAPQEHRQDKKHVTKTKRSVEETEGGSRLPTFQGQPEPHPCHGIELTIGDTAGIMQARKSILPPKEAAECNLISDQEHTSVEETLISMDAAGIAEEDEENSLAVPGDCKPVEEALGGMMGEVLGGSVDKSDVPFQESEPADETPTADEGDIVNQAQNVNSIEGQDSDPEDRIGTMEEGAVELERNTAEGKDSDAIGECVMQGCNEERPTVEELIEVVDSSCLSMDLSVVEGHENVQTVSNQEWGVKIQGGAIESQRSVPSAAGHVSFAKEIVGLIQSQGSMPDTGRVVLTSDVDEQMVSGDQNRANEPDLIQAPELGTSEHYGSGMMGEGEFDHQKAASDAAVDVEKTCASRQAVGASMEYSLLPASEAEEELDVSLNLGHGREEERDDRMDGEDITFVGDSTDLALLSELEKESAQVREDESTVVGMPFETKGFDGVKGIGVQDEISEIEGRGMEKQSLNLNVAGLADEPIESEPINIDLMESDSTVPMNQIVLSLHSSGEHEMLPTEADDTESSFLIEKTEAHEDTPGGVDLALHENAKGQSEYALNSSASSADKDALAKPLSCEAGDSSRDADSIGMGSDCGEQSKQITTGESTSKQAILLREMNQGSETVSVVVEAEPPGNPAHAGDGRSLNPDVAGSTTVDSEGAILDAATHAVSPKRMISQPPHRQVIERDQITADGVTLPKQGTVDHNSGENPHYPVQTEAVMASSGTPLSAPVEECGFNNEDEVLGDPPAASADQSEDREVVKEMSTLNASAEASAELSDQGNVSGARRRDRERVLLATGWTIIGLVFFQLLKVSVSSLFGGTVFEELSPNGWTRIAARQTGAVAILPLIAFLLCDKRKSRSLVLSVMLTSALFCHFVIIRSGVLLGGDEEIFKQVLQREAVHPIYALLSAEVWRMLGILGFLASALLTTERTFGPALERQESELPVISRIAVWWLIGLFATYSIDRLFGAMLTGIRDIGDILYPVYSLVLLIVASSYWYLSNRSTEAGFPRV